MFKLINSKSISKKQKKVIKEFSDIYEYDLIIYNYNFVCKFDVQLKLFTVTTVEKLLNDIIDIYEERIYFCNQYTIEKNDFEHNLKKIMIRDISILKNKNIKKTKNGKCIITIK